MYKEIYKAIKKYDEIVIARHTGADIDALGSQLAMQEIIKETFHPIFIIARFLNFYNKKEWK